MIVVLHIYPTSQGTIIQFVGFDPEADSKKLRDAMKGLGEYAQKRAASLSTCSMIIITIIPSHLCMWLSVL